MDYMEDSKMEVLKYSNAERQPGGGLPFFVMVLCQRIRPRDTNL